MAAESLSATSLPPRSSGAAIHANAELPNLRRTAKNKTNLQKEGTGLMLV